MFRRDSCFSVREESGNCFDPPVDVHDRRSPLSNRAAHNKVISVARRSRQYRRGTDGPDSTDGHSHIVSLSKKKRELRTIQSSRCRRLPTYSAFDASTFFVQCRICYPMEGKV